MIKVIEYNHLEELKQIQHLWSELHGRTRNASYFQSWDWFHEYLIHQGQDIKLKVLAVSVAGRIIGLVPLIIKPVQTRLGTVRALTYPLDSWGVHYSSIGPNPAATLATAMRYISSSKRDWDILDLRYIDELGADVGRTRNAMKLSGFQRYQRIWSESSLLQLKKSWDEVSHSLPSGTMDQFNSSEKSLLKRGEYEFHRYRPDQNSGIRQENMWEIFSQFEKMACQLSGFHLGMRQQVPTGRDWKFLRTVHEKSVSKGALDLCWLEQNNEVISVSYHYHFRGRVDSLGTVYDPSVGPDAARVLMGSMFRDGVQQFDSSYYFNARNSCLDMEWGNSIANSYRYSHFPYLSARSQLLRMYQWAFHKEEMISAVCFEKDEIPVATESLSREPVSQNENRFHTVG